MAQHERKVVITGAGTVGARFASVKALQKSIDYSAGLIRGIVDKMVGDAGLEPATTWV